MQQNNEIVAYHAVTERPLCIGQVITFDENNPNGVYKRVKSIQKLRNSKNCETENLTDLEKMISCNLSRWSQIADRELALEKIRKEKYPMYPSRMACLYVTLNKEEAIK